MFSLPPFSHGFIISYIYFLRNTLGKLLANYDDGRRKGFYCLAVNLLELPDIKTVMEQIENKINPGDSVKEKAKAAEMVFQAVANERSISLKLRKG